eukprot:Selendium_serpulae@DN60_c0_g1_i2.p1
MPVDKDEAKDHGRHSRIRNVPDDVYDRIAAREVEKSEVFTKTGYARGPRYSCRFDNFELKQFGSGLILYFDFYKFLGGLTVLYFLSYVATLLTTYEYDPAAQEEWGLFSVFLKYLLTAGNLGRHNGTSLLPMYTTVALLGVTVLAFPHYWRRQTRIIQKADKNTDHPNDFAIFVSGLPPDCKDESEIAEFFVKNGTNDDDPAEIVNVVIGFDIRAVSKLLDKRDRLEKTIREIETPVRSR